MNQGGGVKQLSYGIVRKGGGIYVGEMKECSAAISREVIGTWIGCLAWWKLHNNRWECPEKERKVEAAGLRKIRKTPKRRKLYQNEVEAFVMRCGQV